MSSFFISMFVTLFILRIGRYFREVASVIKNIENMIGCHTPGRYGLDHNQTLMPEHWSTFGTSKWNEPFFSFSIWLIWIFFLGINFAYVLAVYNSRELYYWIVSFL
jgi:hypothetical protein